MLKVKAGDLDKIGLLFERYNRPLYGFLFHMTYQRETSEDMVQQVFYKMLKYRHTFTGSGEVKHWMYSIARNVLKDQVRRKKLAMSGESVEVVASHVAAGLTPEEHLEKKQAKLALQKAMARLSEDYREVLTLNKFQELKYHEIADILGASETAIRTRVHRAMQELKSIYVRMEQ
ncbi:sigma-70 family RNA polymerase sigma factor [Pedobacter sp. HMF7056]|uniref:Sigma-70 family RNA polymerase sigma factor n=2 Tax=Hufsiella ginkgonis TaxID=2695274 RepID=A0A7K1Y377_9SPHI|nr:sigma-70 family RNA polymerase sigma factor [Hufsiella ginkgonis]